MKRDSFFQLDDLREDEYSNRGVWLIVYLYFGSLLFAAALGPVFAQAVHFFDPEGQSYLSGKPFSDFFNRGRLLCLLILFPVLIKRANLWSWKRLGFLSPGWSYFRKWFPIGVAMMALIFGIDLSLGIIEPRDIWTWGYQVERMALGLIAALLIGFMEETFFRGFVFRAFYNAMNPWKAVVFSSLFFAYLHFKMPDQPWEQIPHSQIWWDDGLIAIWSTLTAFKANFNALLFFNLFLVGVLLQLAFLYTRNLWACVGLHAGWVFVIQSFAKTFNQTEPSHWFFGTERVVDGYFVSLFLIGFIAFCYYLLRKREAAIQESGS